MMVNLDASLLEKLREPEMAASHADLRYVSDTGPGITRRRAGKGFAYLKPNGERLTDPNTLERINGLAIPPAWTDVWISPDPTGHIQATGRDDRGRKQYRYHPDWMACRDQVKFSSLVTFAEALPTLREQVDRDLRRGGMPRERVLASIVWMLDNTMIRIGNHTYTRENNSFGLTTLRSRHVEIEGSSLRLSFVGKSGKEWKLKLVDRRIAKILRDIQELPGQHLFQYLDEDGGRQPVHSQDVNDYIREAAGPEFTSKDFRTWGGTTMATLLLEQTERPPNKRARSQTLNKAIDVVAGRLHNTRAVCRRSYIHPDVLEAWEEGRLSEEMAALRRRFRKPLNGLHSGESLVLRWLRGNGQR